jgi:DNA invertase Pin-like site-specific DNA recombinase
MVGQRVGYSRISTLDQHTERQLDGIEVDKTFTDKASGKNTKRPQLEQLMSFVRSGDTVIVHSMDRFARNVDDLRRLVQTLTGRGVQGNRFLDLIGCIKKPEIRTAPIGMFQEVEVRNNGFISFFCSL